MDMIDEKKIEEAAIENSEKLSDRKHYRDLVVGFKAGARWAINEFLENLWHPADEEPKKNRLVLTDTRSIMDKDCICWTTVKLTENGFIRNWSNYAKVTKITSWLYLDDLLPKEGGKQ